MSVVNNDNQKPTAGTIAIVQSLDNYDFTVNLANWKDNIGITEFTFFVGTTEIKSINVESSTNVSLQESISLDESYVGKRSLTRRRHLGAN